MIKKLFLVLMVIPFLCTSQVADPEPTYTALPQTGFTATVDVFQTASNDATKSIDGNNATFWQSTFSPSVVNLPHWVKIDMLALQDIDGIYIVDRANFGNSLKICTVSTSTDGTTFTQQGGTFTLPYDSTQGKILLKFPATVNCRYYRIDITANQTSGNQVSNLAETGAIIKSIGDPNAYNRALWTITANNAVNPGDAVSNMIDQNTGTYWQSKFTAPVPSYPHILTFDMKQTQPVNQIYYVPRNQLNSTPYAGSVSFSDDGTTFGTEIPVLFSSTFTKNFINLPTVQNHRYFRITITKNLYAQNNPNDTTNPSFYATTMAEVGAIYNTALSATLLSFSSQTQSTGVHLSWATSAEQNSVRYDISRSADGLNFTTIGSVNAAGTVNVPTNYSFTDASPLTGRNFYRLELITANGSVQKSHTINTGFPAGNFTNDNPKNLNIVYFIPSDLAVVPDFESRLSKILLNMQGFYRNEMQRNGRGAKTFGLVKDTTQQKVKLIVINGKLGSTSYPYSGGNGAVQSEVGAYKAAHPEDFTGDHNLIIIPAYTYSANGEPSGGPFYGVGKTCYALDYPDMKQELLGSGGVLGARATKWIGGFAHELGHGLNLPHNHAKVSEEPPLGTLGTTLMGAGNFTYGHAPTFLSAADCAALNNNQIFNDGSINYYGPTSASVSSINAHFSPEKKAIIISGRVTSTGSPATDVSFYNDANFQNADGTFNGYGGNKDYEAVTWNSPIIGTDSLYIEMPITDFQYKGDTQYELRLRTVLQNGNIHTTAYNYAFVNNIPVLNFGNKELITKKDWTILANSEDSASADENMIDRNDNTAWAPLASETVFPYNFKVDMQRSIALAGITLTNNPGNLDDAPRDVDVEVSPDGETWTTLVSNFELPKLIEPNNISFNQATSSRYFRLTVKTTWGGATVNPVIAEVNAFTNLLNKAPEFSAPSDVAVYKDADCNYDAATTITGETTNIYDDYSYNTVIAFTDAITTGSNEDETIISRTWKITDTKGLPTEKIQLITVKDSIVPIISGTVVVALCNEINGSYSIPSVTVSDNCSIDTVTYQITGDTNRAGTGIDASGSFNPGVSVVEWIVIDKSGNTATFETTVTVNPTLFGNIPDVYAVNPGGNADTIYLGYGPSFLTLTPQISGGTAPYSYSWSNGSSTESITISPSEAGIYNYIVTITDAAGCTASLTKTVTVVDIRSGNNKITICHKNDNSLSINVSDVANHVAHSDKLGNCDAAVIASAKKGKQLNQETVKPQEFSVQAYPNPSSSEFSLSILSDVQEPINLRVFDISGKLLRTIKTTAGITKLGNELKSGIYIVEIIQNDNRKTIKLIKS